MHRTGFLILSISLLARGPSAAAAEAPAGCPDDAVPWNGGCFAHNQWETDEKACPDGVIVIPDGEKQPRCVPCDGYYDMQQPINYCAGLLASRTDAKLNEVFQNVLTRFPEREAELRAAQAAWTKSRDKACRRKYKEFEGGSMAGEAYAECMSGRTRKRTADLRRMVEPVGKNVQASPAAKGGEGTAPTGGARTCGGSPVDLTAVDKRAIVVVEKSRFHTEPKACPASGDCAWLRKGYVLRGDEVLEAAISGDFACVTCKATTGWLPLRDLGPPPGPP